MIMVENDTIAESEFNLHATLDWLREVALRRRWWILLPVCAGALAGGLALPHIPKRYTSEATIVAVQQQISPVYVTPAMSLSPAEAVQSMTREVLSRARLLRVIEELGLYPTEERTTMLADRMHSDIKVYPLDGRMDYSAFKLSFSAATPHLAHAVTSRLASLFIEENLRTRAEQVAATTTFLTTELEDAKRKLEEQEERLTSFKLRNLGKLPQEQHVNLSAVTALRTQLQNTTDSIARAQRIRDSLESVLSESLTGLANERTELLATRTGQHPAVLQKDEAIARTKALLDRMRGGTAAGGALRSAASMAAAEDISFAQLRSQVDANAEELASLIKHESRLRGEIAEYQRRLNLTPVTETQLAGILRDYEQYSRDYSQLLNNQIQSQLSASVEENRRGQHFRLIEPPTVPLAASSPNSFKIQLGGVAAGVGLGLVLAFLIETMDRSFHSEKDLAQSCSPSLVVSVPWMFTPPERGRQRLRLAAEWLGLVLILVAVATVQLYV
jgi:polysaccharide chain length determinant protein (PEP-CTERM system associated)